MLVRKFESNPIPVWAWLELFLNPKRYHLKQNTLNYQPLFGKRARNSRPDSRENRASTVKTEMRALFNCDRFVCSQEVKKKKSLNYTSKWDRRASQSFHTGVLPQTDLSSKFNRRISFRQNFQCRLILCKLISLIYVYNVYLKSMVSTNRSKPKSWDSQVTQLIVTEREKAVWALATPRASVHRASWAFEEWEGQRVWRVPLRAYYFEFAPHYFFKSMSSESGLSLPLTPLSQSLTKCKY